MSKQIMEKPNLRFRKITLLNGSAGAVRAYKSGKYPVDMIELVDRYGSPLHRSSKLFKTYKPLLDELCKGLLIPSDPVFPSDHEWHHVGGNKRLNRNCSYFVYQSELEKLWEKQP